MRPIHAAACVLFASLLCALPAMAAEVYLGVRHEPTTDPPGLLLTVVPNSPADSAGLLTGDIAVAINGQSIEGSGITGAEVLVAALAGRQVGDIVTFSVIRDAPDIQLLRGGQPVDTPFPLLDLPELVQNAAPDEQITLTSVKHKRQLEIAVTLGVRPSTQGLSMPPNDQLACDLPEEHPELRTFLDALIEKRLIRADCDDLFARLNARASPYDGYKLSRTVYLLRDGLKGEAMGQQISGDLAGHAAKGLDGYYSAQAYAGLLLDIPRLFASAPSLRTGLTAEQHLDVLQLMLETAAEYVREAFATFTPEELQFIADQRDDLTEIFRQYNYIQEEDTDPRRIRGNLRLIELAKKIDYEKLLLAQLTLAQLADSQYLAGLKSDLDKEFAGRIMDSDLLVRDTPLGKMIISGAGSTWRQGEEPALLIDLGGDDFYTTTAGGAIGVKPVDTAAAAPAEGAPAEAAASTGETAPPELLNRPVSLLIEFSGNDAYESTTHYSQGSGSLGCGLLIDMAGDDEYIGTQWAQGCGYFGCGALLDMAGDDTYRGLELCQGAAIFGTGMLVDYAGNDRMEGQMKCQAFGGAHAVGLLIDVAGDDYRYAKGRYPTNYGDAGIFDSWSQGCAMGFREIASGGIAAVIDMAGKDYSEAGNFSQGGGYYFGFGMFHDRGWEADRYVGSRYNQGFCAHQAVGVFLEQGGDDFYTTRQAVAQGLAWDECTTTFIDYGGDDTYQGGGGFSQGASAHNALCLFWDRGGRDSYIYAPGQARAGGNDYHGGTSLSLFVDEGGAPDFYDCPQSGNDLACGWPEHGFYADLPGTLSDALAADSWRELWVQQEEKK